MNTQNKGKTVCFENLNCESPKAEPLDLNHCVSWTYIELLFSWNADNFFNVKLKITSKPASLRNQNRINFEKCEF